ARRGQQAVGKVALVEHEALHERLAVQPDTAVRRAHTPQPEIAERAVDDFAVAVEQRRLDVVERGRGGMPGSDRLQGDPTPPRGVVLSVSGSSARTTRALSRDRRTFVISTLNGVCPPSWRATSTSLTQTVAR